MINAVQYTLHSAVVTASSRIVCWLTKIVTQKRNTLPQCFHHHFDTDDVRTRGVNDHVISMVVIDILGWFRKRLQAPYSFPCIFFQSNPFEPAPFNDFHSEYHADSNGFEGELDWHGNDLVVQFISIFIMTEKCGDDYSILKHLEVVMEAFKNSVTSPYMPVNEKIVFAETLGPLDAIPTCINAFSLNSILLIHGIVSHSFCILSILFLTFGFSFQPQLTLP